MLRLWREVAVEGHHDSGQQRVAQQVCHFLYLCLSWQKHQYVAIALPMRPAHHACHGKRNVGVATGGCHSDGVVVSMDHLNREHPSLALHQRGMQCIAERRGINRCRHQDEAQVITKESLRLSDEGKCEVGIDAALMKLVEDYYRHPVERRVIHEHTEEHPLSYHFYARCLRDAALETHSIAYGLPHGFSQYLRHAFGNLSRCQASWLKHHYLSGGSPSHDGKWQECGLSCSRRCRDDERIVLVERSVHTFGNVGSRQRGTPGYYVVYSHQDHLLFSSACKSNSNDYCFQTFIDNFAPSIFIIFHPPKTIVNSCQINKNQEQRQC